MPVMKRALLIVLDGVGIGALADADQFGDVGADTLGHVSEAVGGLQLPQMQRLGLGNIAKSGDPILGVAATEQCSGYFGKMAERSGGKDSTVGHWELCGLILDEPFRTFPHGFPETTMQAFYKKANVKGCLGNKVASGTGIIDEFGAEHMDTALPIVYTSADSVFQIAAHSDIISVERLYDMCEAAFEVVKPLNIGRVIARPFIGTPGNFSRTEFRKDFSVVPPDDTLLDCLQKSSIAVHGVGKVDNLFAMRGFDSCVHTRDNMHGVDELLGLMKRTSDENSFSFANLVDFDTKYGHRGDAQGFANALQAFDSRLPEIFEQLTANDLLIITADHGNDPLHPGSDHTREYVPLMVTNRRLLGNVAGISREQCNLGIRSTFADVGATLADFFEVELATEGTSFLDALAG